MHTRETFFQLLADDLDVPQISEDTDLVLDAGLDSFGLLSAVMFTEELAGAVEVEALAEPPTTARDLYDYYVRLFTACGV